MLLKKWSTFFFKGRREEEEEEREERRKISGEREVITKTGRLRAD